MVGRRNNLASHSRNTRSLGTRRVELLVFSKIVQLIYICPMNERIARLYLDTSVFGGYYDAEFSEDTQILF